MMIMTSLIARVGGTRITLKDLDDLMSQAYSLGYDYEDYISIHYHAAADQREQDQMTLTLGKADA